MLQTPTLCLFCAFLCAVYLQTRLSSNTQMKEFRLRESYGRHHIPFLFRLSLYLYKYAGRWKTICFLFLAISTTQSQSGSFVVWTVERRMHSLLFKISLILKRWKTFLDSPGCWFFFYYWLWALESYCWKMLILKVILMLNNVWMQF